jgi:IPT/TIG domain/Glucose / Sorbosone dehydrogenase
MRESYFSAAVLVANLGRPNFSGVITYDASIDGNPLTGVGPNGVEVFAAGLRNPFGVVYHSNGNIYATDNGPNTGYGAMATGCSSGQQIADEYEKDKLNLVKRGGYYGHPNHKRAESDPRQCTWQAASKASSNSHTAPLMRLHSSTNGLVEFESDHFNGQMRGDLVLSKYGGDLYRVILSEDGESVKSISNPALPLAGSVGLAVTQAPDGSLIDARYVNNECFVYKPQEIESDELDITSVFPRRGGVAGGSTLAIFGANFMGTPQVTVGGNPCANVTIVSQTKIQCVLPIGNIGAQDVTVTIGSTKDTFAKGYRYILGKPNDESS